MEPGLTEGESAPTARRDPAPRVVRVFTVVLALGLLGWMAAGSNPAQSLFPYVAAAAFLLLVGAVWLLLLFVSLAKRRRPPRVVLLAPLLCLVALALTQSQVAWKLRWLASEPAFTAVVLAAGPPDPLPAAPVPAADEEQGWSDIACSPVLGAYVVQSCSAFPGGYLFFDAAGSGLLDDGGVAFLPYGVPADAGTGWWEDPQFEHLHGDWYAFSSSW